MKLRCMTCHLTVVKMLEIHMATTTALPPTVRVNITTLPNLPLS